MNFEDFRSGYWYQCPECGSTFGTSPGLRQHMQKRQHTAPYFKHKPEVHPEDVTCRLCDYVPAPWVEQPKKSYSDHMRRSHRIAWVMETRPLTIYEYP